MQKAVKVAEKDLNDAAAWVLRYSGTEPLARVMVEGEDEARVAEHAEAVAEAIRISLPVGDQALRMRLFTANLDSAALLRDASGGEEPRLTHLAVAAEMGGADAIRVSANESLLPVHESDLYDLRRVARCLEICVAPTPSLLKMILEVRPDRVVLADEIHPGFSVPHRSRRRRSASAWSQPCAR